MSDQNEDGVRLTQFRLRSPWAAAGAGIVFSVLIRLMFVLVQVSIPTEPTDSSVAWLATETDIVALALGFGASRGDCLSEIYGRRA